MRSQVDDAEGFPALPPPLPLRPSARHPLPGVWPNRLIASFFVVLVAEGSRLATFLSPSAFPSDTNRPNPMRFDPQKEFQRSLVLRQISTTQVFIRGPTEKFHFVINRPISSAESEFCRELTDYCPPGDFEPDKTEQRYLSFLQRDPQIISWLPTGPDSDQDLGPRLAKLNAFVEGNKAATLARKMRQVRLEEEQFSRLSGMPELQVDYLRKVSGLIQWGNQNGQPADPRKQGGVPERLEWVRAQRALKVGMGEGVTSSGTRPRCSGLRCPSDSCWPRPTRPDPDAAAPVCVRTRSRGCGPPRFAR